MENRGQPLVRDEGVAGSNPATPTKKNPDLHTLPVCLRGGSACLAFHKVLRSIRRCRCVTLSGVSARVARAGAGRFVMDFKSCRSSAFAGSFVVDPYLDLGEVFQEREQDAVWRGA
jgi:hypothetical protein